MAAITTLLFDADDTLWDFQAAQCRETARVLAAVASDHPEVATLAIGRVVEIRRELGRETPSEDVISLRVETFRRALAEVGVDDPGLAEALTEGFLEGIERDLPLYPDTRDVLAWCAERYRMAVVTNGTKGPEAGGLGHFFELSVLGQVEGVTKPDPRLVTLALERLGGVPPNEAVLIGDHEHVDVAAAAAAGTRSILVDRHRTGSRRADAVVGRLADIPPVLEAMG